MSNRPPQLEGKSLIPPVDQLVARAAAVESQIQELQRSLPLTSDPREQNGIRAHLASLRKRKEWYVSRIRRSRPIEALGVHVGDDVTTAEAGV